MNAAEVRDGLRHRWPDSEYLTILEAPQSADRQGRKLDMLVVSQWRSRGHERDGVEIKVSVNDWRRELHQPGKADWWWDHVHRFWIAAPVDVAQKIRDELPAGWGLLAVAEGGSHIMVKPVKNADAKPFTWEQMVGLLRGAADAGANALQRSYSQGLAEGKRRAELEHKTQHVEGVAAVRLTELRAQIAAFEAASGVKFDGYEPGRRLGEAMRLALHWSASPTDTRRRVSSIRDQLTRAAEALATADSTFAELEAAS